MKGEKTDRNRELGDRRRSDAEEKEAGRGGRAGTDTQGESERKA